MLRLAVLCSGSGSNLQAIIDAAVKDPSRFILPVLTITDRPCKAVKRAEEAGIETLFLDRKKYAQNLSLELGRQLADRKIDIVALAGWLSILDGEMTEPWTGRMVNIHPALLPLYGGPGMYGQHVHKAVLDAGDKESGCSVHLVTGGIDEGKVLAQVRVPVLEGDTTESLAARILVEEHKLYPRFLSVFLKKRF